MGRSCGTGRIGWDDVVFRICLGTYLPTEGSRWGGFGLGLNAGVITRYAYGGRRRKMAGEVR